MVWYGMIWYGMVWYGMVWYDMVWYGMITGMIPLSTRSSGAWPACIAGISTRHSIISFLFICHFWQCLMNCSNVFLNATFLIFVSEPIRVSFISIYDANLITVKQANTWQSFYSNSQSCQMAVWGAKYCWPHFCSMR